MSVPRVVACPGMMPRAKTGLAVAALLFGAGTANLRAAEHITLRNGFDLICDHREVTGDRVRLYLTATGPNFMEVRGDEIAASEFVTLPVAETAATGQADPDQSTPTQAALSPVAHTPTVAEIHEMVAKAGAAHDLDVALLDSVIRAESGGNVHAVSHAGARGLMQLMPGTATQLGVTDSFRADQNINGGTQYLNDLLVRYNDNLAMALAAYNAGPAAVDKYHGIPPYRETRLYVARIIRDFNRRKLAAAHAPSPLVAIATPATASLNASR